MARKLPKTRKRRPVTVLLLPATIKLLKAMARDNGTSQSKTIDHAVETLAVAEAFGVGHLKANNNRPA